MQATPAHGGPDGQQLADKAKDQLDYLSTLCKQLHVQDPVEQYFMPVVGKWNTIHDEAQRWRNAAKATTAITDQIKGPLGQLDAAWQGKDATAFMNYVGTFGLAGVDMAEAMTVMGSALDSLANGIRSVVTQMVNIMVTTADDAAHAMSMPAQSEQHVREFLDDLHRPTSAMFDSVRQALDAFVKLCDKIQGGTAFDGIKMSHQMPTEKLALPTYESPNEFYKAPAKTQENAEIQPSVTPSAAGHSSGDTEGESADTDILGGPSGPTTSGGAPSGAVPGGGALDGGAAESPAPGRFSGADERIGSSAAAAATAPSSAPSEPSQSSGGIPMMPMGMGGMGQGGGDREYKPKRQLAGDITEIFGTPERTAPRVIGEDDEEQPPQK